MPALRIADPYDLLPPVPALTVTSGSIHEGQPLPMSCVHPAVGGRGVSPDLRWEGAPAGTRGFAVTCLDPDAPTGSGFWHWFLTGLPATVDALAAGEDRPAGSLSLRNDLGETGYAGAAPPPGDAPHRYLFAVHALDTDVLPVEASSSCAYASFQVVTHTLARGLIRPIFGQP